VRGGGENVMIDTGYADGLDAAGIHHSPSPRAASGATCPAGVCAWGGAEGGHGGPMGAPAASAAWTD